LFSGHQFGGIHITRQAEHQMLDGRKMWVIHGDYFDAVIQRAKWLAVLGDYAYEFILKMNRHFNALRSRMGMSYWSLSAYLKHKVKQAVSYISHFEEAVASEAKKRGYSVVVCGHIHHAEIRPIGDVLYCNDGDWVESLTALVEHHDGQLEIIRWQEMMEAAQQHKALAGT
jgi:UDP-2,3-diacylglucosamine pyrophosphatase LpxH